MRRITIACYVSLVGILILLPESRGQQWVGSTGNWSDGTKWSGGVAPGTNAVTTFDKNINSNYTVTINSGSTSPINSISVSDTGVTFQQTLGTFQINTGFTGASGGTTYNVGSGNTLTLASGATLSGNLTFGGSGTVAVPSSGTLNLANGATVSASPLGILSFGSGATLSGPGSGNATLKVVDGGLLSMAGGTTTTTTGGTLTINLGSGSGGASFYTESGTGAVTLGSQTSLVMTGSNSGLNNPFFLIELGGNLTTGASFTNKGTINFNGITSTSSAGPLLFLDQANGNTFTNDTTGSIQVNKSLATFELHPVDSLSTTFTNKGTVSVSNGGTLQLDRGNGFSGLNFVNSGTGTFTIDATGGTLLIQAGTSGSGATFTGNLTVPNNGSVRIDGGGTAGGLANINGNATVNSGGTIGFLSANKPGTLAVSGTLTLDSGSNFLWNLGAFSTANPGTDWDQISVTGALTVTSGAKLKPVVPNQTDPFWNSDHTWTHIIATSTAYSGGGLTIPAADNFTVGTRTFWTSADSGGVTLHWSAIPEPSSLVVLGIMAGSAAGYTWLRRRAQRPGTPLAA